MTTKHPTFSVIIPLFNKRAYIQRAVKSVLDQTFSDFELIVVDDGSTDGSADMIAHVDDPRLKIVRQPNAGVGLARNTGISAAAGIWLALLDADDAWLSDHLSELVRVATAFPEAGMISCAGCEVVASNVQRVIADHPSEGLVQRVNYFERAANHKGFINASSVAIRADVAETIGGFSSRKAGEDIEYWVRVALEFPVAVSSRVTSLYFRDTGGVMLQMVDVSRDQPEPPHAPIHEFSAGVAAIFDRSKARPDLLKRADIRTYINGMLVTAIRGCLYRGHFRSAKHYSKLISVSGKIAFALWKFLAYIPDPLLTFLRTASLKTRKGRY